MVGAVGMALAIEYDRTGVLTFLIPGVIGIFILIGSWVNFVIIGNKQKADYIKQLRICIKKNGGGLTFA